MIRRARQRRLALERRADARAISAGKVGIDLERLLDQRDDRLRVVLLQKGPPEHRGAGRAHLLDEVAAARQLALVIGRHKQVLAPLAPVGTGQTEVRYPLEPHVVDHAEREWRRLNDDRSLGDVQIDKEIDGVRIGRQEQGLGVHQLGEDQDRVVRNAGFLAALEDGRHGSALVGIHERLDAVHQVEVVVDLRNSLFAWCAVLELERAETRLQPVGRGDRRRDRRGGLGGGRAGQCQRGAGQDQREATVELFHNSISQGLNAGLSRPLHGAVACRTANSRVRPRSAARSWRRTVRAGCRAAASGKSPCPEQSESSCPV